MNRLFLRRFRCKLYYVLKDIPNGHTFDLSSLHLHIHKVYKFGKSMHLLNIKEFQECQECINFTTFSITIYFYEIFRTCERKCKPPSLNIVVTIHRRYLITSMSVIFIGTASSERIYDSANCMLFV